MLLLYNQTPQEQQSFRYVACETRTRKQCLNRVWSACVKPISTISLNRVFVTIVIETRNKKQRRYQHVGTRPRNKTGMLPALSISPASARNIPTDNKRRAKASWQDDDIDITCHQKHMPNQLRQVMSPNPRSLGMQRHVSEIADHHSLDTRCVNRRHGNDWAQVVSPNPHSLDIQGHVSERSDRHNLDSRCVTDRAPNRWRRSTASQITVAALLHRLESVERQNEELRQRISEMDRSNPSSIHGTETTSYPAGSLSENDTSTNQRESDQISEPVARPEIRRMTPQTTLSQKLTISTVGTQCVHQRSRKTEALNLPNRVPVQRRKLMK